MGGSTKKKTSHAVQLFSQRLIEDGAKDRAFVKEHLNNIAKSSYYDLTHYYHGLSGAGAHQFINFKNFSKRVRKTFPQVTANKDSLDISVITDAIAIHEGVDKDLITNVIATWNNFSIDDWVEYTLQRLYSYDIHYKTLVLTNIPYTYSGVYNFQNYSSDIHVTVDAITGFIKTVYTDVLTLVTNKDETTDTKLVETRTRTEYTTDIGIILESIIDVISTITTDIPIGTEQNNYSSTIVTEDTYNVEPSSRIIPMSLAPAVDTYYILYRVNGEYKSWFYFPTLKNNDSLDQIYIPILDNPSTTTFSEDMYPMVMIRGSHFSVDEYDIPRKTLPARDDNWTVNRPGFITEDTYKDSKYILRALGLDIHMLMDGLADNPDIDYISDAFLGFAVSPYDTHPMTSKTLYDYFDNLNNKIDISGSTTLKFNDYPYNIELNFLATNFTLVDKVIGDVGDYSHSIVDKGDTGASELKYTDRVRVRHNKGWNGIVSSYQIEEYIEVYYYKTFERSEQNDYFVTRYYTVTEKVVEKITPIALDPLVTCGRTHSGYPCWSDETGTVELSRINLETVANDQGGVALTIWKQETDTACRQIKVASLTGTTVIGWSWYGTSTTNSDATNDTLMIPLPISIIKEFSVIEKIELMERTLRMVIYSEQLQVVEYYQMSGFWQVFIQLIGIIIAVLIAVFTWGSGTPVSAAILAGVQALAIGIGISLIVRILLTFVNDPTLRMIIGIVGAIAGLVAGGGSIDLSSIAQLAVVTAAEIVNMATAMSMASIQKEFNSLVQEQEQFTSSYESRMEEYESAWEGINQNLGVEDIVDITLSSSTYEYVDDGVLMVMSPTSWYDIALNSQYQNDLLYNGGTDKVSKFHSDAMQIHYLA